MGIFFIPPKLYSKFKNMYNNKIPSAIKDNFAKNENKTNKTINKTHNFLALAIVIFPDAKGRFFFDGLHLSDSISFISFMIYINEAAIQNSMKAIKQHQNLALL